MKYFLLLFLISSSLINAQTSEESILHDGEVRSYFVHLPSQYDGTAKLPVVLILHGLGDNASNMMNTGFHTLGEQEGFISVYPQGLESSFGSAWNNGSNLSLIGFTPDDIGFISKLIDYMIYNYSADSQRIYSCGFSMGGIMSYYLACNLSNKIAAIASQAGPIASNLITSCAPQQPISVLHIHGDSDATVDYANGSTTFGLAGAVQSVETFAHINDCIDIPTNTDIADTQDDGYTVTKSDYFPCDNETEVILMTVHNADHIWLGSQNDISTSIEFWNFFKTKIRNQPTSNIKENDLKDHIQLFPNPVHSQLNIKGLTKEHEVQLFDNTGKLVLKTSSNSINLKNLPSGIYIAKVNDLKTGQYICHKITKN